MENWLIKANELFPELKEEIDQDQSEPLGLWNDLFIRLVRGYETKPINEDLIRRIYDYADWCFNRQQTGNLQTDLSNAVAIGLMENLPLCKAVSEDLYRWLS